MQEISSKEKEVLETATQFFVSKGVRQTTIDEIAKAVGISKKTIYLYFETKSVLINQCVQSVLSSLQARMEVVSKKNYPPIQEMLELGKLNINTFKIFSKNALSDLRKFYPHAWDLSEEFKSDYIFKLLALNLEQGIRSGDYRENLQIGIVTHIYMSLLESAIMQHSYLKTDVSLDEVYREHLLMHIYSICSEQGRIKLEQLLQKKDYF